MLGIAVITLDKTLVLENGAIPGFAEPGETLTYQIVLNNSGNATGTVYVTEAVPLDTIAVGNDDFNCNLGDPADTSCIPTTGNPLSISAK